MPSLPKLFSLLSFRLKSLPTATTQPELSMQNPTPAIFAVPTSIITGFLGVGKTTSILQLLQNKPKTERWAVLVNEFGEIGIDGSLLEGSQKDSKRIFIREVPGGCMCCTAGLPMQVALNQLLDKAKPDRLLIEPTGLGHPSEVVSVLSSNEFAQVISIQQIITLVDARNISNPRYTGHETFNEQLAIADLILGNKMDRYDDSDRDKLICYLEEKGINTPVRFISQGQIDPIWLEGASPNLKDRLAANHVHTGGEEFSTIGWQFGASTRFDHTRLYHFLCGLSVDRLKGVFLTNRGIYGYNLSYDALSEIRLNHSDDSRLEIINPSIDEKWEEQLQDCIITE